MMPERIHIYVGYTKSDGVDKLYIADEPGYGTTEYRSVVVSPPTRDAISYKCQCGFRLASTENYCPECGRRVR